MRTKPNKNDISYHSSTYSRGFTLVELLVVITIIVALAALAVFITRNVRDKAHQANALSSLRQVAAFNVAYSPENNGDINTMRWKEDKQTEGRNGRYVADSFWGRLQPFLFADVDATSQPKLKTQLNQRIDKLLNSTDSLTMAGTAFRGPKSYQDGSGLPIPLGFNSNLHMWGKYLKTTNFGNPALTLYASYGRSFFDKEDGRTYTPLFAKWSCDWRQYSLSPG
jgi:prepilin-type N-terminal cleavage/methylation domain-containing protein